MFMAVSIAYYWILYTHFADISMQLQFLAMLIEVGSLNSECAEYNQM